MIDPDLTLGIQLDDETRESWEAYLDDFKTLIHPMFRRYGVSMDAALIIFEMNKVQVRLRQLVELIDDDDREAL